MRFYIVLVLIIAIKRKNYKEDYMQLKSGKPYERLKLTVNMFAVEDVLLASGDGTILDAYNDGWTNTFWGGTK